MKNVSFILLLFLLSMDSLYAQTCTSDSLQGKVKQIRIDETLVYKSRDQKETSYIRYYDPSGTVRLAVTIKYSVVSISTDSLFFDSKGHAMFRSLTTFDKRDSSENTHSQNLFHEKRGYVGNSLSKRLYANYKVYEVEASDGQNWTRATIAYRKENDVAFRQYRDITYYTAANDPAADTLTAYIDAVITKNLPEGTKTPDEALQKEGAAKTGSEMFMWIIGYPLLVTILLTLLTVSWLATRQRISNIFLTLLSIGILIGIIIPVADLIISEIPETALPVEFFSWIVVVSAYVGMVSNILHHRCPRCHYCNSLVTRIFVRTVTTETYTEYADQPRELTDVRTDRTRIDDLHCPRCGYKWRSLNLFS